LFDELEGEEDTHKDATPFKTVNPRGQEHRSRRHRTPTMTAGTGQQQRQRQQQHARDPSVDEVGGHLPVERLPSFHPVSVTTEVDLWWMGQKKSSHSPCSWSCIHTLTNVPVAASLEIGMEFCRPFSTTGLCRIDVDQLANATSVQKFPVSRVRRKTQNRELLGYLLLLPISSKTSQQRKISLGDGGDNERGSLQLKKQKEKLSKGAKCRSWLRSIIIDLFLLITFLMIFFALLPHYIFHRKSLLDINVHNYLRSFGGDKQGQRSFHHATSH
jgi:hypothetical protein